MLPTRGGGAEPPGTRRQGNRLRGAQSRGEERQGLGLQEWPDGSRYEGGFVNGLKHGPGKYSWTNGEYYEGSFHRDYRHGDGLYSWPTGHKFTGKFYLNRKEGYGQQLFPDGATFQGLFHADHRFGPGVMTYPDGRQDVGLWLRSRLLQLCSSAEEGFSLKNLPDYAAYTDPAAPTETQPPPMGVDRDLLLDDDVILPPGIESYSTDGDHLPLPPGRRRELDRLFYGEMWEPDAYQGYQRDPLSALSLQARMQAHINKHRRLAGNVGWDVAAVLSLNRDSFGPKGPLEVKSELFIQHASRGETEAMSKMLQSKVVHPDVADANGHTALIAATVNCHNAAIHLLLDVGVDIDRLNCEGMSALAVCHVLYFPFQSLNTAVIDAPAKEDFQVGQADSAGLNESPSEEEEEEEREEREGQLGGEDLEETLREGSKEERSSTEDESKGEERVPEGVDRSIQVLEGDITLGSVLWKDCRAETAGQRQPAFDSACSVSSYGIHVTEEMMQRAAEALSRSGIPPPADTQETVRQMAAMKIQHRTRLKTLKLLLERGADPNVSRVPMPALFLSIMAADTEAVRRLLLSGARTDIPLPPKWKGVYPLHVAAALPGPAGPGITELLLHAITDPDKQADDRNEIYGPDKKTQVLLDTNESPHLKEGGRTALHVACQRDGDYQNSSKVVALLLSHGARTDLLWSGHSPLSLAIATGNEPAVEELLNGGADPNIPLGCRVGSALCALANFSYHLGGSRAKLLDMLVKAGADILMPVMVGDTVGTAVDYAHHSFKQDLRIANTPFHALKMRERQTFKARRQLLRMMGDLLRQTAYQREREDPERQQMSLPRRDVLPPITEMHRKAALKFCYQCGRSASVRLTACLRCHKVFFCSKTCRLEAWDERHKKECVRVSASADCKQKIVVLESRGGPRLHTAMLKSKTLPGLELRSKRFPDTLDVAVNVSDNNGNLKENYSCN